MTTPRYVDRAPVNAHIDGLLARHPNLTPHRIATLAGVADRTLSASARATYATIDPENAARIMAVTDRHVRLSPGRYDVDVVAKHVRRLLAVPHSSSRVIAAASGVSARTINYIASGGHRKISRDAARAIVTTTPADVAAHTFVVDARTRTIQQIGSMRALGWSYAAQETMLEGVTRSLIDLCNRPVATNLIDRAAAEAVDALYQRVGDTPGPDPVVAETARKAGWYTPIHYDDDGNLIPEARPTGRNTANADPGSCRDRLAGLGRLLDGDRPSEIGEALGYSNNWVTTVRARVGLTVDHSNQDELVGTIREALDGIDYRDPYGHLDDEDVDYVQRWGALYEETKNARTVQAQRSAAAKRAKRAARRDARSSTVAA